MSSPSCCCVSGAGMNLSETASAISESRPLISSGQISDLGKNSSRTRRASGSGLPVAIGLAPVSLNSSTKARTTELVDEPLVENAMLWPLASLMVLIGDEALAYQ